MDIFQEENIDCNFLVRAYLQQDWHQENVNEDTEAAFF